LAPFVNVAVLDSGCLVTRAKLAKGAFRKRHATTKPNNTKDTKMQKLKGILACGLVTMLIFSFINQLLNGDNAPPYLVTIPVYAGIGLLLGLMIAFVFDSLNRIFAGALGLLTLHIGGLLVAIFVFDVTLHAWFTAINFVVVMVIGAICGAVYRIASR
jgi:peptidoglycan/LPS O-acetylase OafA/YrhL